MSPKAMLIAAIVTLTSLNGSFFLWAKDQFDKVEVRNTTCQKNYEDILRRLAHVDNQS